MPTSVHVGMTALAFQRRNSRPDVSPAGYQPLTGRGADVTDSPKMMAASSRPADGRVTTRESALAYSFDRIRSMTLVTFEPESGFAISTRRHLVATARRAPAPVR